MLVVAIAIVFFVSCPAYSAKKIRSAVLQDNSKLRIMFEDMTCRDVRIAPPLCKGENRKVRFHQGVVDRVHYTVEVTGEADDLAEVIISEFIPKGRSGNDEVELYALKGGNVDGITVFSDDSKTVLPHRRVEKGEYLTCSLPMRNSKGFLEIRSSSNRGTSRIMDKVVYISKDGSEAEISDDWQGEGVDISKSTPTRSVNRRRLPDGGYADTNTKNDFYVTVSKGATMGAENNPKVFEAIK